MTGDNEDGQLPATLQKFRDAVHQLIGETVTTIDGATYTGNSLYEQLSEAVDGEQRRRGDGGGSKSRPPLWLEGFDVLREIDMAIYIWQTGPQPPAHVAETVWRLQVLGARSWRPQDCRQLTQMTDAIMSWAVQIQDLLNPKPAVPLRGYQCPRCLEWKVRVRDSAGEWVNQPVLLFEHGVGTTCRNRSCRDDNGKQSFWNMQQSRMLGELLMSEQSEEIPA